ncbi:Hepatocyte nuclear factor 3-gamma [Channa argus]|uniref:Hepatocyte nuclear factor 3-gamma n=2 Tax=Channa argus TaxID=215402 RepID=A0A6G1PLB9_CHAAH|nr:Hepatocyte nuclear factor 3-gamma [Channa argus]
MSLRYLNSEMTMEDRSGRTGGRERLGLSFTIDYLLFNKGVRGSKEEETGSRIAEQTANSKLNHQNPEPEEVGVRFEIQERQLQRSEVDNEEKKVNVEEGNEEQQEEGEEEVTTTMSTSSSPEKSADKPNQSYIALISKAILASEQKKLLLCDIYQWIMDNYPYFKSQDKNWRNSVRHNLSLNDCFIKAGRSDNGKGHFWAIHPSNYQDFSNGDYHCRRARRRVRRVGGQLSLSSLSSPYNPSLTRPHRTTCWCCPQSPALPLSCLAPRLYWPWSSVRPQVELHPRLHTSVP